MRINFLTGTSWICGVVLWTLGGQSFAQTAVACTKMNIMYHGVDNSVWVVSAEPLDTLWVGGGTITGWEREGAHAARVHIRPQPDHRGIIQVIAVSDAGGQDTSQFRLRTPHMPVVVFAGKLHGEKLYPFECMAAPGISARMENFDFDAAARVVSYTLYIQRPLSQQMEIYKGTDHAFTPEIHRALEALEVGSVISFEDIQVTLSGFYPYPRLLQATYTVEEFPYPLIWDF